MPGLTYIENEQLLHSGSFFTSSGGHITITPYEAPLGSTITIGVVGGYSIPSVYQVSLIGSQSMYATQSLFATSSISASYASTASYISSSNIIGYVTALSASWASASISSSYGLSASYATTAGTANAISFVPATATSASWVSASVFITTAQTASYISSSAIFDAGKVYNHTASYATTAGVANTLASGAYNNITAAYATNAATASWATTATTANAISFVPITATSASWVSASVFITTAQTASYISSSAIFDNRVYNHTASFSTSASYSNNSTSASYGISSSYSLNTTSASFAITSAFASTPWIISASNVYYNAGNVGIGTTAPTAKFQTVGDIIVSRIADAGGVIRGDNVNGGIGGALKLGVSNTASDQFIAFGTTVSGATGEAAFTEKMRVLSSGNVGIGTTTPSQKLEVLGNISASGYIISTTAGSKITGSLLGTASNASTSSYYTANNYFCRQTPISGAINGSNYNFTWSPPPIAGTEMVFWNGVLLSSDGDYTISGGNVTLTNTRIPLTGDKLVATYFA